jgi:chemotaxis receptor (MCP) glutamine deamidase CheD
MTINPVEREHKLLDRKINLAEAELTHHEIESTLKEQIIEAIKNSGIGVISNTNREIVFDTTPRIGKTSNYVDFSIQSENHECIFENILLINRVRLPCNNSFPIVRQSTNNTYRVTWGYSKIINSHFKNGHKINHMPACRVQFSHDKNSPRQLLYTGQSEASVATKGDIDYLATTGVGPCHVLILWDRVEKKACFCHHLIDWVTREGLIRQSNLLTQSGSKPENIEAKVIGGYTERMGWESGYFYCIKPTMEELGIAITETYLGDTDERPGNIIFDIDNGNVFSMDMAHNVLCHAVQLRYQCKSSKNLPLSSTTLTEVFDSSDTSMRIPVEVDQL